MGRRVVWTLEYYEKTTEKFAGEYDLSGIDLPRLWRIFGAAPEDPMPGAWPVGPAEAEALKEFVDAPIELDKYYYFLECLALPGGDTPPDEGR